MDLTLGIGGSICHETGQIIATSHDLGPQELAEDGKSPYFRKIQIREEVYTVYISWHILGDRLIPEQPL